MSSTLSTAYQKRFGGIARLYGQNALQALNQAHMVVIGLGGVGSWAAEALARSGVGTLTLIELDDICISNTNRQIHALDHTVGKSKLDETKQRLTTINPEISVNGVEEFLDTDNIPQLISEQHHIVIDAMDSVFAKACLVSYCSARKIKLVTVGSSGGKQDPTQIQVADLGRTTSDPMLSKIRHQLYRKYNFTRDKNRKFRVDAVFSTEQMVYPKPNGSVCTDKQYLDDGVKLDCASGFGSSTMLTGTFGFVAASRAIERYLTKFTR